MKSLVVLSIFASVSAFAAGNVPSQRPLDRVLQIFEASRPPVAHEVEGWFAGRCFRPESPTLPFGGLLVGRIVTVGGDNGGGPLFPPNDEQMIQYSLFGGGQGGVSSAPDYWDSLDVSKVRYVEDYIRRGYMFDATSDGRGLRAIADESNLVMNLRLYPTSVGVEPSDNNGYQVAKITVFRDHRPSRAGDLFAACYFFKQLR